MTSEEASPATVARVLLENSVKLRRGENLIVETWNHTLPWATACVVEARRIGAHPVLLLEDEVAYWRSIEVAPVVARWSGVGDHEWRAIEKSDAYVFFPGPADRPRFLALPSSQVSKLTAYNPTWYRHAKKAQLRGVRCLLGYASDAEAAHWGVSPAMWRSQLVRGIVEPDYRALEKEGEGVAKRLERGKSLRITAANGTDLTVGIKHRRPSVEDGSVGTRDLRRGDNMTASPPGSVIVAVDERSAEGTAVANRPSFLRAGRVEGGQWDLLGGRLQNYWYTEGHTSFDEEFGHAPKGRDVLSVFSLGLNSSLAPGVPRAEDQEAGAVTLAVGGNSAYGGTNSCPFLSWIVIGEASVAIDGEPLCDRGKIV